MYASSDGFKSFERSDLKGGIFLFEVRKLLEENLKNNLFLKCNLTIIQKTLKKKIKNLKESNQTPEFVDKTSYEVYLY